LSSVDRKGDIMDFPGGWELVLVLVVLVVLFGSKKLPDAARSLGRSLRIFKAETKGLRGDDHAAIDPGADPTAVQQPVVSQPVTGKAVSEQPVATPPASNDSH
jgi:sec-independent protein translocase protein TatA